MKHCTNLKQTNIFTYWYAAAFCQCPVQWCLYCARYPAWNLEYDSWGTQAKNTRLPVIDYSCQSDEASRPKQANLVFMSFLGFPCGSFVPHKPPENTPWTCSKLPNIFRSNQCSTDDQNKTFEFSQSFLLLCDFNFVGRVPQRGKCGAFCGGKMLFFPHGRFPMG